MIHKNLYKLFLKIISLSIVFIFIAFLLSCKKIERETKVFTKTAGSDTANAHLKHNALIDFASERAKSGKPTIGRVIIGKETNSNLVWQFCRNKIENTKDQTGWDFFTLATINKS